MKNGIKKAIVFLLVAWFSVTCYSSLARIRRAYLPSVVVGWQSTSQNTFSGYRVLTPEELRNPAPPSPAKPKRELVVNLKPRADELRYFYQNAHRVVQGETYLLFLLNLIPLSVAVAVFYLLQNKTR